ncbi:MAG: hypothetical protein LBV78_19105 [Kitasatospora sp.]|jgi:hypothetical protein|nr:hypothetical protein [Kitasatospora sp.]
MLKRIRAALARLARTGRAPEHRAHDPREARRYRAAGDIDIAKGQSRGLPPGGQAPPGF